MENNLIISLATYGERLKVVKQTLESLLKQLIQPTKYVINVPKDHYINAPEDLKEFINNNSIFELNLVEEDLGPHNKYFTVFQKYKDYDIITVDDDYLYHCCLVQDLLAKHRQYPDVVIARSTHHLSYRDNKLLPQITWCYFCKVIPKPSYELLAIGANGVYYPSEVIKKFNISEANIADIKNILYGDDIYLKYLEDKNDVKVCYAPCTCMDKSCHHCEEISSTALYKDNVFGGRNDEYIKLFPCTKRDDDPENQKGIGISQFKKNWAEIKRYQARKKAEEDAKKLNEIQTSE